MLDLKGNTAIYLMYSYARISSISKKAGVKKVCPCPCLCPCLFASARAHVCACLIHIGPDGRIASHSWPSVGPQLALSWPSVGPQLALSWPSVGPQLALSWPSCGRVRGGHVHVVRADMRCHTHEVLAHQLAVLGLQQLEDCYASNAACLPTPDLSLLVTVSAFVRVCGRTHARACLRLRRRTWRQLFHLLRTRRSMPSACTSSSSR
jgi:hypothetical protein